MKLEIYHQTVKEILVDVVNNRVNKDEGLVMRNKTGKRKKNERKESTDLDSHSHGILTPTPSTPNR